jgi:magnesium-transporting ATPase (P-type)
MSIPVDSILIRGSGVAVDESAMTGESDEMKKETFDVCQHRKDEHIEEEEERGKQERDSHSIPSPILLSGT